MLPPTFLYLRRPIISIVAVKKYEDHVEIAADTQITHDMSRIQNMKGFKLVQEGEIVIGFAGDGTIPTFLRLYFEESALPEVTLNGVSAFIASFYDFVDKATIADFSMSSSAFIFVSPDRAIVAEDYYIFEVESCYSIGVAPELCDSLMKVGKSPAEVAIETCKVNIFCSKPVEEYHVYKDRIDYNVDE